MWGSTTVPATASFHVGNAGGGDLDWTVSPQETWIGASPLAGSADADVSVWIQNPEALGLGTHSGAILVGSDSPGVQNSPQTVTVTLSVVDELRFVYLPFMRGAD
jgi:hypothetical protein